MKTRRTLTTGAAALALLVAACGQYPHVHERAYGAPGGVVVGPSGSPIPSGGIDTNGDGIIDIGGGGTDTNGDGIIDTGGGGSNTFGGGDTTFGGGDTNTGGGDTNTGGGDTNTGGGDDNTGGGDDNTGGGDPNQPGGSSGEVWGDTIMIGIHAPITGAAPVTIDSFRSQNDLYFRYGNDGSPVNIYGRKVDVVVEDDRYNPSTAQQVCQKMKEQDHAFLIVGGAGADQIVACARWAQAVGEPYLSAGVTQAALGGLGNYFAVSETYVQQAAPLAHYIKKNFTSNCSEVKMIAEDTPNFDDAADAFANACPGADIQRAPKSDNGGSYGAQLCTGPTPAYKAVYPLVAPVFFLQMAGASNTCHPQFVGVGITQGIDTVANTYCRSGGQSNKLQFFSPAPAFADSDKFDPNFRRAAAKAGVTPDDIGWLLWGLDATLAQLLLNAGRDLNQQTFLQRTSTARVSVNGYGPIQYSPSNHFGARAFNVLTNVCEGNGGHYVTKHANVSDF